jgi:prepilin-type N-terminal cleavage/methylation domain-containing protein
MIGRISARCRKRSPIGKSKDEGFTLIELLVVLVILPLIIGAVAEAIIVSFENQPSTSGLLSNTTNAELTTQYFVRDVQGASEVFAPAVPPSGPQDLQGLFQGSGYSQYSPEVCGVSSSDTLLVALYRPGINGAASLDVAYWQHTDGQRMVEVIRYACTVQPDFSSSSPVAEVLVVPPPGSATGNPNQSQQVSATASISPTQFAESAATGWTSTTAHTVASSAVPSLASPLTIDVASTTGFVPGTVTLSTTLGTATVSCSGVSASPPSFTGCSSLEPPSDATGQLTTGAPVTQSSISSVQLSVNEPSSSYSFNALGSPR